MCNSISEIRIPELGVTILHKEDINIKISMKQGYENEYNIKIRSCKNLPSNNLLLEDNNEAENDMLIPEFTINNDQNIRLINDYKLSYIKLPKYNHNCSKQAYSDLIRNTNNNNQINNNLSQV